MGKPIVSPVISGNGVLDAFSRDVSAELARLAANTAIGLVGRASAVDASSLEWSASDRLKSRSYLVSLETTAAAGVTASIVPIVAGSVVEVSYQVLASSAADAYSKAVSALYRRVGSAAPTRIGGTTIAQQNSAGAAGWTASDAVSGNDALMTVSGAAATRVQWWGVVTVREILT